MSEGDFPADLQEELQEELPEELASGVPAQAQAKLVEYLRNLDGVGGPKVQASQVASFLWSMNREWRSTRNGHTRFSRGKVWLLYINQEQNKKDYYT